MHKPLITIIFPTFKRPEDVVFNLRFFRENISCPYEVFILDNSPESMKYDFAQNENYIFLNKNIGTSSRNIGIQQANSSICLLLDDDSHPFPGVVEKLVEDFKKLPIDCAGLISEIHNPDGGREASLLPTVFHGAGVAFKTEALKKNNVFYPENFCFYGEEYRMSLEVYRAGLHLKDSPDFKVMHRRSKEGRDLNKIFYYLGRNNRAIWNDIVPTEYLESVLYDSQRRYELTSRKEQVLNSFSEGLLESLEDDSQNRMTESQFRKIALIDNFKQLNSSQTYIICGAGKFPSLWADIISRSGSEVFMTDMNSGLIGNFFGNYKMLSPQEALTIDGIFLIGHSSKIDTEKWQQLLEQNNRNFLAVNAGYEPHFC